MTKALDPPSSNSLLPTGRAARPGREECCSPELLRGAKRRFLALREEIFSSVISIEVLPKDPTGPQCAQCCINKYPEWAESQGELATSAQGRGI